MSQSLSSDQDSTQILELSCISLDKDLSDYELDSFPEGTPRGKAIVLDHLANLVITAGKASHKEQLLKDIYAREAQANTGLPGGIAIPHCRTESVTQPTLAFARLSPAADFGVSGESTDLVFMILAPEGGGNAHMKILSSLARALVKKNFLESLRQAQSPEEVQRLVLDVLANKKKKNTSQSESTSDNIAGENQVENTAEHDQESKIVHLVGITACPTGIAHTYMAADALRQAAESRSDLTLLIEPQGASGGYTLSAEEIAAADAVIFATDVGVRDRERFDGKPVVEVPVKRGISHPHELIEQAYHLALARSEEQSSASDEKENSPTSTATQSTHSGSGFSLWARRIQQAIMTGVSYMIPFIAAGGLLMALSFVIGGYDVANVWQHIVQNYSLTHLPEHLQYQNSMGVEETDKAGLSLYLGSLLYGGGTLVMSFLVPALSGYIAFGLAGRPGIAPGFLGGALSVFLGAGFIGGLLTGLIAGAIALLLAGIHVPRWLAGMMPVLIIPLIASLVVTLAMFLILGEPLAALMTALQDWLSSMNGSSAALLGAILGLMMCFDLGGPVNKAAYLFATAGLSTGDSSSLEIMAAVMAAGMVPPLALALATTIQGHLFSSVERENGKAAWLLGASFISEGAIPFAAVDPLRVIPSMMLGGAITGSLSMVLEVGSRAPHGGIWVAGLMTNGVGFLIAVLVGTVVSALAVIVAKQLKNRPQPNDTEQPLLQQD